MIGLLWHAAVLAAAGIAAFLLLRRIPAGAPRTPAAEPEPPSVPAQTFAEIRWWERRLASAWDDPGKYPSLVRDRLADLAAERLRLRHGVGDPARAVEILGDDLHRLLTAPDAAPPTRAELARLITRIEEI
ncbi:hypothetical protein [Planomonospora venezuelensis]|uniref:Uncharacterized protein n=1 Tax=Planomonospora venezuelensis TaxID=1999 RepID=A0A841DG27_PLAVE|nr:hypothetical protein [Planomonospora venezuelensis]MBB5966176.1 hypothetical protein [Planomonospora venezuelensis]GIN01953.1 hypothetical protein Pve01_36110 [Planomonospora venezuelensis]